MLHFCTVIFSHLRNLSLRGIGNHGTALAASRQSPGRDRIAKSLNACFAARGVPCAHRLSGTPQQALVIPPGKVTGDSNACKVSKRATAFLCGAPQAIRSPACGLWTFARSTALAHQSLKSAMRLEPDSTQRCSQQRDTFLKYHDLIQVRTTSYDAIAAKAGNGCKSWLICVRLRATRSVVVHDNTGEKHLSIFSGD